MAESWEMEICAACGGPTYECRDRRHKQRKYVSVVPASQLSTLVEAVRAHERVHRNHAGPGHMLPSDTRLYSVLHSLSRVVLRCPGCNDECLASPAYLRGEEPAPTHVDHPPPNVYEPVEYVRVEPLKRQT